MMSEIDDLKNNIVNVQTEIVNKFRLPIFLTYSIILVIYNWDILFYLSFQNGEALSKINYVKQSFFIEDFERIWKPVFYALVYSILFPFLQLLINLIVQFSKNFNNKLTRTEELESANHKFNIQRELTGSQSLQQLQIRIDQLLVENEKLISTNNLLLTQVKYDSSEILDTSLIINSEYDKTAKEILKEVNNLENGEKSTFIEVISIVENSKMNIQISEIKEKTIFPNHVLKAIELLVKYKLIDPYPHDKDYFKINFFGSKFIKYFKSNFIK